MTDKTTDMQTLWPRVLEAIKCRRRFPWILLSQNASVLSYDGATLKLALASQSACDSLVDSGSGALLEEVLAEVLSARPAVVLAVEGREPLVLTGSAPSSPVAAVRVSVAVTTSDASSGPSESPAPALQLVLAQTAFLMHEQGNSQAAALLADVEDVELVPGNRFGDWQEAILIVPAYLVARFTENVIAAIQPVFGHVAGRHGLEIGAVTAAPVLPDVGDDWRRTLQERLAKGASNQASRTRVKGAAPGLIREGFVFDSREEVLVYEALKRAQAALPEDSTISIFPLPMGRVGVGNAWTPDFLVTLSGKVGIIEVDGPHHHKRFAADATRDRHWRNSGIVNIERILVEETSIDGDLDALVRQFLTRLREYR
jgi:hypothetical protein